MRRLLLSLLFIAGCAPAPQVQTSNGSLAIVHDGARLQFADPVGDLMPIIGHIRFVSPANPHLVTITGAGFDMSVLMGDTMDLTRRPQISQLTFDTTTLAEMVDFTGAEYAMALGGGTLWFTQLVRITDVTVRFNGQFDARICADAPAETGCHTITGIFAFDDYLPNNTITGDLLGPPS